MANRSFTAHYRDARVKRPTFDLPTAIDWFVSDHEVEPTTMQTYRSHLNAFAAWLVTTGRPPVLASLTPETVTRHLRATRNPHTRMNKCIALKSFATYLARKRIWYGGTDDDRLSVLREVQQPKPSSSGMPGYSDDELRSMFRAVDEGRNRLRNKAVLAVTAFAARKFA